MDYRMVNNDETEDVPNDIDQDIPVGIQQDIFFTIRVFTRGNKYSYALSLRFYKNRILKMHHLFQRSIGRCA